MKLIITMIWQVFKIYDVITLVRPTLNVKKNAILKCFWRAFLVIS